MLHFYKGGCSDFYIASTNDPRTDVAVVGQGFDDAIELRVRSNRASGNRAAIRAALHFHLAGQHGAVCLHDTFDFYCSPYLGHTLVLIHPGVHSDLHIAAADDPRSNTTCRHGFNYTAKLHKYARHGCAGRCRCRCGSSWLPWVPRNVSETRSANLSRQQRTVRLHGVIYFHPRTNNQIPHHNGVLITDQPNTCHCQTVGILGVQVPLQFSVWLHLIYFDALGDNAPIPIGHALHLYPRTNGWCSHAPTDECQGINLDGNTGNLPLAIHGARWHIVHRAFQFHEIRIPRIGKAGHRE